jgi:gliding motility-associated-like protein
LDSIGKIEITHVITIGICQDTSKKFIYILPSPMVDLADEKSICEGDSTLLIYSNNGVYQFQWSNGSVNDSIWVNQAGYISLRIMDEKGCTSKDSTLIIVAEKPILSFPNDTIVCDIFRLGINLNQSNATFLWQDGSNKSYYDITETGEYLVTVTLGNCSAENAINVEILPKPLVNLGTDVSICDSFRLIPSIQPDDATIIWENGSAETYRNIFTSGVYNITSTLGICTAYDTIALEILRCKKGKIYIPNVFNPESPIPNNTFKIGFQNVDILNLEIYDRWGELVYKSTNNPFEWDGKFRNKLSPSGVYAIYIRYKDLQTGNEKMMSGDLTLIR